MASEQAALAALRSVREQWFKAFPQLSYLAVVEQRDSDSTTGPTYCLEAGIDHRPGRERCCTPIPEGASTPLGPVPVTTAVATGGRQLQAEPMRDAQWPELGSRGVRRRPCLGGDSIGNGRFFWGGSLGLVVSVHDFPDDVFAISNWHVLVLLPGLLGDGIVQPARPDGGSWPEDEIGTLVGFRLDERFDVALLQIKQPWPRYVRAGVRGLEKITGVGRGQVGARVELSGRESRPVAGTLRSCCASVRVRHSFPTPRFFHDQLMTTPMAKQGDSGAVLAADGHAIGLLCTGTRNATFFNPLAPLFEGEAIGWEGRGCAYRLRDVLAV